MAPTWHADEAVKQNLMNKFLFHPSTIKYGLGACGSRGRKGNKARRRLAGYQRRRLAGKRRRRSASYQGCGFCSRVRIDVGGSPTGVDRHCLWY
ncbi:hypothetical protein LINGRAHAP2_LOCUS19277 [Linum grandiflorum]